MGPVFGPSTCGRKGFLLVGCSWCHFGGPFSAPHLLQFFQFRNPMLVPLSLFEFSSRLLRSVFLFLSRSLRSFLFPLRFFSFRFPSSSFPFRPLRSLVFLLSPLRRAAGHVGPVCRVCQCFVNKNSTAPFPTAFFVFVRCFTFSPPLRSFSRPLRSLSRRLRSLVFLSESSSKGRRSRRPGFCRVCQCFVNKTQQRRFRLHFSFSFAVFLFPDSYLFLCVTLSTSVLLPKLCNCKR